MHTGVFLLSLICPWLKCDEEASTCDQIIRRKAYPEVPNHSYIVVVKIAPVLLGQSIIFYKMGVQWITLCFMCFMSFSTVLSAGKW